jgi:hypothetical protein
MPLATTTRTPLTGQAREGAINNISVIHKDVAQVSLFLMYTVSCTNKL